MVRMFGVKRLLSIVLVVTVIGMDISRVTVAFVGLFRVLSIYLPLNIGVLPWSVRRVMYSMMWLGLLGVQVRLA